MVHKLLVEEGRVTAVRYESEGVIQEVGARIVVLCGGAIHTPQLLMLSGIRDGAALHSLGIEVEIDQPAVGRHMMEHPLIRPTFRVKRPSYSPTEGIWQKAGFSPSSF